MSTHRSPTDPNQSLPTQTTTQPTTGTDSESAPMMFSTENKVQIQGLFRAESDEYDI